MIRNRYGKQIVTFPREQTFKKWILSLSKAERVKLEKSIGCTVCPIATFCKWYFNYTSVSVYGKACGIGVHSLDLPTWAQNFIKSFDKGKIQNLRQWALQKQD